MSVDDGSSTGRSYDVSSSSKMFLQPTILEALCEIRFAPSPETKWNPSRPAPLYEKFMKQFPIMEPYNETELELTIGPLGPSQNVRATNTRIRFSSDDGKQIIQVSDRLFSYHQVSFYENWEKMRANVIANWHIVCDVIMPLSIIRIGVRYINKIPRTSKFPTVGSWLKPTSFIPLAIVDSKHKFVSRVEASQNEGNIAVVNVTDRTEDEMSFTIYDIDMIRTNVAVGEMSKIEEVVEELHAKVEEEFFAAHTPLLTRYLEGAKLDEL